MSSISAVNQTYGVGSCCTSPVSVSPVGSQGQRSQQALECKCPDVRRSRHAFTLIELLVVISIIALLVGILLPALGAARRTAQTVKCASNMRQLGIGFMGYATDNEGKFPLNSLYDSTTWWYQGDVIGTYLPGDIETASGSIGGLAMPCPSDIENAARSYTMNFWASSDPAPPSWLAPPSRGELWDAGAPNLTSLMLAVESWSLFPSEGLLFTRSWLGGEDFTPYQSFVDRSEVQVFGGREFPTPLPASRLDFNRHSNAGDPYDAQGSANFLYGDGHVSAKSDSELVDRATGKSTYDSLWSPIDRKAE